MTTQKQVEVNTLKLWESFFGNAVSAKAGNYTLNYKDFTATITALIQEAKIEENRLWERQIEYRKMMKDPNKYIDPLDLRVRIHQLTKQVEEK